MRVLLSDKQFNYLPVMSIINIRGLLKQIISDDLDRVYENVSGRALEWAAAGFIEEANSLLEKLWAFNIPHSRSLCLIDEGLQIIWKISKKTPQNIPFILKTIAAIEASCWSRTFHLCGGQDDIDRVLSKPINELSPSDAYHKIIITGDNSSENPDDLLAALQKFIEDKKPAGSAPALALLCGALLAAKHDKPVYAEYFIKRYGEGYIKNRGGFTLADMMRTKKCAAYLLGGMLADTFHLTSQKCQQETEKIIETLAKRMARGRSLVYGKLSWKQLLNKISTIAIKEKTIVFSKEVILKNTLLQPAATREEITMAEKRLHKTLPKDYKNFLLSSNGFECFSYAGTALASIDKVDFLINVYKDIIDIWADTMDESDEIFTNKLRNSIIIGGLEEEQQLLLISTPGNNWECWHFSNWNPGEVVYAGFRFYIEEELQMLENELQIDQQD